jgi:hypothetical protein
MRRLLSHTWNSITREVRALWFFLGDKDLRRLIVNKTWVGDGILTTHFIPFSNSREKLAFDESFSLIPPKHKTLRKIHWRFSILAWAYRQTIPLGGAAVECGVWYGVLSKSLMNLFPGSDSRTFYLFDSWGEAGFEMQGPYKRPNYLTDIYEIVERRFQGTPSKLIRGSLPQTFQSVPIDKISLLMIDLNSGWLEYEILELAWKRIPLGGVVYLDDYGQDFPIVREAIDKFVGDFGQNLLVFPTGQAIIIKK